MNPEAENNLEDWEARLADYTFGIMEQGAASDFERQLSECRAHVTLAQQYTQVISALGYAVAPAEPPSDHKARFMARLADTPQETVTRISNGTAQELPPVNNVISIVPTPAVRQLEAYSSAAKGPSEFKEGGRIRGALPRIAAIAAMIVVVVGVTAYVTARLLPTSEPVPASRPPILGFKFGGLGPQPSAQASCIIDTKTREVEFWASNLQPLPSQQVYELWWLKSNSEPIAAGTFTVDSTGKALHIAKLPDDIHGMEGATVTLEQAPGVQRPAGERVLYGDYRIP